MAPAKAPRSARNCPKRLSQSPAACQRLPQALSGSRKRFSAHCSASVKTWHAIINHLLTHDEASRNLANHGMAVHSNSPGMQAPESADVLVLSTLAGSKLNKPSPVA
eukprot:4435867-Alexandrium_andersonii.AAC.1